jgi:hypothetical protein
MLPIKWNPRNTVLSETHSGINERNRFLILFTLLVAIIFYMFSPQKPILILINHPKNTLHYTLQGVWSYRSSFIMKSMLDI